MWVGDSGTLCGGGETCQGFKARATTQPQSGSVTPAAAMCRPGGREPAGGEGGLQSHSLQNWLELDPGPPRHHTLEVVPSGPPAPSAKGWAGPGRDP